MFGVGRVVFRVLCGDGGVVLVGEGVEGEESVC